MTRPDLSRQRRYDCHDWFYEVPSMDPFDVADLIFKDRTAAFPQGTSLTPTAMRLTCEGAFIANGVVIHAADRHLVEELVETDLDAMVCDAKLPYPIMEITVPTGIAIGDTGYEMSAMLLMDWDALNGMGRYKGRLDGHKDHVGVSFHMRKAGDGGKGTTLTFANIDWNKHETVAQACAPRPLYQTVSGDDMASVLPPVAQAHMRLAIALMLYFQTSEQRATTMEPMPAPKEKWQGFNEDRRRCDHRARHFRVINITPKRPSVLRRDDPRHEGVGTHASPHGHWRRRHMRVLRHESYGRNADGSFRTVWVDWAWVGDENINRLIGHKVMA